MGGLLHDVANDSIDMFLCDHPKPMGFRATTGRSRHRTGDGLLRNGEKKTHYALCPEK